MFKSGLLRAPLVHSCEHPFSDIVSEFGACYVQNGLVYVSSHKGTPGIIQTPTRKYSGPFVQLEDAKSIEYAFLNTHSNPTIDNSKVLFDSHEIFFHKLIQAYVTNKPAIDESTNSLNAFFEHTPLHNATTTILTKDYWIETGGVQTKQTNSFLDLNGTIFVAKNTRPIEQFQQKYQQIAFEYKTQNALLARYFPVFEKKHKQLYFGKKAIDRSIQILKKSNTEYSILTHCTKSELHIEGNTYLFDPVTLTTEVSIVNDNLTLTSYSRAPAGYEHVFVHTTGTICYNTEDRFTQIGLTTSTKKPNPIQSAQTITNLKKVLDEGPKNLLFGNKGKIVYANSQLNLQHRIIKKDGTQTKYVTQPIELPQLPNIDSNLHNGLSLPRGVRIGEH